MKRIFNLGVKQFLKHRYKRILNMRANPIKTQHTLLSSLISRAKNTAYGKRYKLGNITNPEEFAKNLPIITYEDIKSYIYNMMDGASNILCPGKVNWYAKSSGTTGERSKYIPVSEDSMYKNNVAASWDTMSMVYHEDPDCQIFQKKSLIMGGAIEPWEDNPTVMTGDISAILLHRMPAVGRPFYSPDFETAVLADWEEKIDKMVEICAQDDVVMFGGVPTWSLVLFNKMLKHHEVENMHEIWPNVRYYFHGGVGFGPYRQQFEAFFPNPGFHFFEVYNASEGYFAIQDGDDVEGMLLLLDNDVYYEFIEVSELDKEHPETTPLQDVSIGKNYAIVISTSAGLWRYMIGDTVSFTSIHPYRIRITGRTKHFINVFGEEVMVGNAEKALALTIAEIQAKVAEYTVAPIFMDTDQKGGHQWLIEFEQGPEDLSKFEQLLDENLQKVNSDYAAKRYKDLALVQLKVKAVPRGTFFKWLSSKGKLGGQNKVPRLYNTTKFVDELLEFV